MKYLTNERNVIEAVTYQRVICVHFCPCPTKIWFATLNCRFLLHTQFINARPVHESFCKHGYLVAFTQNTSFGAEKMIYITRYSDNNFLTQKKHWQVSMDSDKKNGKRAKYTNCTKRKKQPNYVLTIVS